MHKILVTGAAGFIGSRFCKKLLEEGFRVTGIDNFDPFYPKAQKMHALEPINNNPNFTFVEGDILKDLTDVTGNFDAVVHLAAKAGVRPSLADPAGYIKTNITGTQKVHEFLLSRNITKFIFASSSSVYGNNTKSPFEESDVTDKPLSPYAYTKKACELMNYSMHHLHGTDVINLRFFTVYGPGQRPDLAIHKFVKQVMHKEFVTIYGDGTSYRDYTYIDDITAGLTQALSYCIEHNRVYETVNLGSGNPIKLIDLINIISDVTRVKPKPVYAAAQPGDVDGTFADIRKATSLLQYRPKTDIAEGISAFVEWIHVTQS